MKVRKDNSKLFLLNRIGTNNPTQLISKLIDLYEVLKPIPKKSRLTDKEHVFFICCILAQIEGETSYISGRSKQIYRDLLNIDNTSDVGGLLRRLKSKKWVRYSKKTKKIFLPDFFKDIDLNNYDVEVSLTLKHSST